MKQPITMLLVVLIMISTMAYGETITRSGTNKGDRETRVVEEGLGLKVIGKVVKLVTSDTEKSAGAIVFVDGHVIFAGNIGAFVWQLGEIHEIRADLKGDIWELQRVDRRP
jgi:hypothetical protein